MLSYPVTNDMMYFDIPAAKVNDIAAWILLADEAYMRRKIETNGFATVIKLNGVNGLSRITEIPKLAGTAEPYYGTIGGAYHFRFQWVGPDTLLKIEHVNGRSIGVHEHVVWLGNQPRFESHAQPSNHWYMNRLERLIENRNYNYSMYIDGEIYANMVAVGWQKESARRYFYEFIPTTVGCVIKVRDHETQLTHDLTVNVEW
jgi:hypothetical protein